MIKKKSMEVSLVAIVIFLIGVISNIVCTKWKLTGMIPGIIYYLLLILTIIFVVKIYEKEIMKSLGLYTNNLKKQILIGVAIFLALTLVTIIPLLMGVSKQEVLNFKPKSVFILVFFIFYDICLVGFGEELIFRGYFLERINTILDSKIWAVIISSILFGLYHYPNNHNITQVISATILGIIFSICKLKISKCGLISLALAHGLNDAFIIFLGYVLL
ncbi:CPBP family intramembrane metalloprotease [Clostridium gasigenes]|uniref:CPBP family intramembrane glutamic endopeptidase n=1 Tax=Clostridium gasigenes TaxID=94869 RepID=UPI001C0E88FB|nr:type II CAAX endopeptidase family protein [Clostridium gasigenes]MBU3133010.1 CPBP family intramembrane metalloprotease [Clostridium gasigenes]